MNARKNLQRLFGYPWQWTVVWCIAAPGSACLVGRFFYEETLLTWFVGPQMVGFSFFHTTPGLATFCMLSMVIMHVWVVYALYWVGKEKICGRLIPHFGFRLLVGTAMAIGFLYIPYSWLGGY